MTTNGKAIIISAPSGAGKTTIVKHLLETIPALSFSISACSRDKRPGETDGKDYYFISAEGFRDRIAKGDFVEWQEVYPGSFYGTLKSELERIWGLGGTPIFDVDVKGALNLKKFFGDQALAVFIRPPSIGELENRLRIRSTEDEESLRKRLSKAEYELSFAGKFDVIVVNHRLEEAFVDVTGVVTRFLNSGRT